MDLWDKVSNATKPEYWKALQFDFCLGHIEDTIKDTMSLASKTPK